MQCSILRFHSRLNTHACGHYVGIEMKHEYIYVTFLSTHLSSQTDITILFPFFFLYCYDELPTCSKFQKTLHRFFDATHVTSNLQPLFISKVRDVAPFIHSYSFQPKQMLLNVILVPL